MKHNLLFIFMMVVTAPVFAQSASTFAVSVPEPSTMSLIAAGILALGIARRKATKP
jgi:PEP-CTERM motif